MNTRKNKRKSNSRLRRHRRRRCIKRTKKMKGGGFASLMQKLWSCYSNLSNITDKTHCLAVASVAEQAMDIPKSIQKLKRYAEIAALLLNFYQRIILPEHSTLDIHDYNYLQLKKHFLYCIEELRKSIQFLTDHNIINALDHLASSGNPQDNHLFKLIQNVISNIKGMQISEAMNKSSIAIWADWYRSDIKDKIAELTALLTEFNMLGQLRLRDKTYDPNSDEAKKEAAAAAAAIDAALDAIRSPPAGAAGTNSMESDFKSK